MTGVETFAAIVGVLGLFWLRKPLILIKITNIKKSVVVHPRSRGVHRL